VLECKTTRASRIVRCMTFHGNDDVADDEIDWPDWRERRTYFKQPWLQANWFHCYPGDHYCKIGLYDYLI